MNEQALTLTAQSRIDLAGSIRREHELCRAAFGEGLTHAIECGRLLTEAKEQCVHGEWLPWLAENTDISERTAQAYMRLHCNREQVEAKAQRVADLPMREALALLAESGPDSALESHQLINSSKSNEYYTPRQYLDAAREVLDEIDLDPASCEEANQNVQARTFYTIQDDGLSRRWSGRVWMNPPYGRDEGESEGNQAIWSRRLIDEFKAGNVTAAIMLVNAVPGNKWFAPLWEFPICFVDHRIAFINSTSGPTHSNAIVYLGSDVSGFARVFGKLGPVVRRIDEP